jgi:hypothetical protein
MEYVRDAMRHECHIAMHRIRKRGKSVGLVLHRSDIQHVQKLASCRASGEYERDALLPAGVSVEVQISYVHVQTRRFCWPALSFAKLSQGGW